MHVIVKVTALIHRVGTILCFTLSKAAHAIIISTFWSSRSYFMGETFKDWVAYNILYCMLMSRRRGWKRRKYNPVTCSRYDFCSFIPIEEREIQLFKIRIIVTALDNFIN